MFLLIKKYYTGPGTWVVFVYRNQIILQNSFSECTKTAVDHKIQSPLQLN